MVCHHSTLITVEGDAGVMEGLFRMFHVVIKFRYSTFEYTSEVPRY